MKRTVYLDSTIPSYNFDERKSLVFECKITRRWWDEESNNYIFRNNRRIKQR